ncbi:MAG: hypothetical protein MI725_15330 [Pirellulales bacterium]|nr:hypothetical protein [Pirellulales bacterium]
MTVAMDTRHKTRLAGALLSVVCTLIPGCFDAESVIEAHRENASGACLDEVDLGEFHVTLPQPAETTAVAEIQFHAFGQVANHALEDVKESLEKNGIELQHRLLIATRQLKPEEINDPKLTSLRTHLVSVFNETLPGEPLKSVGFYHFRYTDF